MMIHCLRGKAKGFYFLVLNSANSSGIYDILSDRHVAELSKFWAIGSGMSYALGAMYHAYEQPYTARIGIEAVCECDKSCALPMDMHKIVLSDQKS